jgi:rfaE bifunctional protein nucleotidyltransferase chain/domain/rfaE bifunctional protein kinase chain/domain
MTRDPRLVVVGDALLDRDLVGTVERVAPDAPVPVLAATGSVDRPGGAALAAALAADLDVAVTLVAPVPDDAGGARLRDLLDQAGVELCAVPSEGPMPEKIRIRAGGQMLMRVDQSGVPAPVPDRLPKSAVAVLRNASGILVSDYGRGITGHTELRRLLGEVAARRPVVWDPHPRGEPPVPGVRLVTPNEAELAQQVPASDQPAGTRLAGLAASAAALCERWWVHGVAVTLGADGALVAQGTATPLVVPAPPCVAQDTCGAGDRFAAAVAAALTRGAVLSDAVTQAVAAASAYVAAGGASTWRPGGTAVPPDGAAIGLVAAQAAARAARLRGGTVVATGGCFDLLHVGHLATLRAARQLGDYLVVCLNSDRSVRALKGPTRPLVPQADRARLVAALDCVDAVVTFDELTPERLLDQLRPDIWVKGGDYFLDGPDGRPALLPEAELVRRWGGQTVVVPYVSGRSTTRLIAAARPAPASIEGGS